ncbi:DNA polymerase II [Seongchinamella sediminis]|uniref:DNA polymerase n=1 Tax=Seongchinamella sediminis TaxID=2283635 RepID=A0A3L7DWJ1_9GAMM|nr:DNA polymerase II [Seongchinamella sediminis]RLQ21145.1 DNA polymerase II [Seongchinamella sediminis]
MNDVTISGFLLTRNWRDGPNGIELEYWFATDRGPLCALVRDEQSVFFLAADAVDRARALAGNEAGIDFQPLQLMTFAMTPVVGVYCRSYRRSRQLAEQLRAAGLEPLEADINPADRYLMERFIAGGAEIHGAVRSRGGCWRVENPRMRGADCRPPLKVLSLDIETAMSGLQLYSIGVHGVAGDEQVRRVFMVGEGADQDYVQSCANQQQLLERFLDWLADYDPDVLIGWNVINFDCWYLQRVADRLGRRLLLGRDRRPAHWRQLDDDGERRALQCPGRVVLDGIDMLRAAFYSFESFALENVARELLGEGKLLQGAGRGEEIGILFAQDKSALAAYNLKDCELASDIFAATSLLEFAIARSAMTGLNMDRMGGSVASFDNLYLPRLHRAGYVAPNASSDHTASPGGWVLDSIPGIYDHVLVLDFKSLYPSIIRTFGIDPLGLALGLSGSLAEDATVPGFLDARFAREGHILPGLIQQLWQQRDEARRAGDEPLSQAIKIIMNSFYGVLGSPGCRFFDARLASSITRRGHQILQRTRDRIEQAGHRVIYGDTDSVFVWIHEAGSDAQAISAGRALEHDLNRWWRREIAAQFRLGSVLELQFETHYKRFLMPTVRGSDRGSKKRYAGVVAGNSGDELVFKGLENVRTDWTRLARDFQRELYRRIFFDEPFESYVRQVTAQLRAGERDGDLVYRKRLRRKLAEYERNVPPHVQAARLCESRGLQPPSRGSWVEYVITTAGAEPAAALQAPLDYEHYVERQLQPVADGILGFVGTSYRGLVDRQIDLF